MCSQVYAALARKSVKGIIVNSDKLKRAKKKKTTGNMQFEQHGGDVIFPSVSSLSITVAPCENMANVMDECKVGDLSTSAIPCT